MGINVRASTENALAKAFEFVNPPLSLKLKTLEKNLRGKQCTINVYAKAYDYGVLTIIFEIPTDFEMLTRNVGAFKRRLSK